MKKSDLYETPPEVFIYCSEKYGPFDVDLCAEKDTKKCKVFIPQKKNSLVMIWKQYGKSGWLNPPYSDIKPWLAKARVEAARGFRTIALLPADTSTKWWHENIENNPNVHVELLPKRIHFLYKGKRIGSPKFGSAIVVFFPSEPFSNKAMIVTKVDRKKKAITVSDVRNISNKDLLKISPLPKPAKK